MCWNEQVSLNTFVFSSFVLLLVAYNNIFTQYKIDTLDSVWKCAFFASFISMQLVEFFIWRNLGNKYYNALFSYIGFVLLILQPFFSIMIISNEKMRSGALTAFFAVAVPYVIYKLCTTTFRTEKSGGGHLLWLFLEDVHGTGPFIFVIWMFFFSFGFVFEKNWVGITVAALLLIVSIYNYMHHRTWGTMWCWIANSVMVFYAAYLLFYLPFKERNAVC